MNVYQIPPQAEHSAGMSIGKKIAILGCSFSDNHYQKGQLSWSHFLARDNPHLNVVNFAQCASSVSFAVFTLNWFVHTGYKPDLIIMNIPYIHRDFAWEGFGIEELELESNESNYKDLYSITRSEDDFTNNLFSADPTLTIIYYSTNTITKLPHRKCNDDLLIKTLEKNKKFFKKESERLVMTSKLTAMNNYGMLKLLPMYESLLGCRIFYYMYDYDYGITSQNETTNITNLEETRLPRYYIPTLSDKNVFFDESHFNSYGNELFYNTYIRNDIGIAAELEKLRTT